MPNRIDLQKKSKVQVLMIVNLLQSSMAPLDGILFRALLDLLIHINNYPTHSVIDSKLHLNTQVLQECHYYWLEASDVFVSCSSAKTQKEGVK